jgi:hypothetical protein
MVMVVIQPTTWGEHCGHGHHNTWYNEDCREARYAFVAAEKQFGEGSEVAKNAYRKYRSVTKQARKKWETDREYDRMQELRSAPKRFWSKFKENSGHARGDTSEWTDYFRELLKIKDSHVLDQDLEEPLKSLLFPDPSEAMRQAAASLNKEITEVEVLETLKLAADGKPRALMEYQWNSISMHT